MIFMSGVAPTTSLGSSLRLPGSGLVRRAERHDARAVRPRIVEQRGEPRVMAMR